MKLVFKEILDREIVHYAAPGLSIMSCHNRILINGEGNDSVIRLPNSGFKSILGASRLARRALRLDKCNVVPVSGGLAIIRQGKVYHYCRDTKKLTETLKLKNCRNVLHQSVAVIGQRELVFGEYGANADRLEVPIYRSRDGGKSWETAFLFPPGKTKHVHGCYWDPCEEKIWVFTGDFANECHVLCAEKDFSDIEWIGSGEQIYRACNAFFESDAVHWIMDSPLQDSYHVKLDRQSRSVETRSRFPGPVWYSKRLADGYYLAATAQETGVGVHDRFAHLMVSTDLEHWETIHRFEHDGLPRKYFKCGVIAFADGQQTSDSFYLFFEAIKGFDGKAALCKIET